MKYSSDTSSLQLYPADSMMTLLPSTGDGSVTQKYFHLPDYVCAPIQQGDVVGTVELKLAGETIGVVDLIAGQDVSLNPLLFTVARFREFLGSLYLKVVITLSIISIIIYFAWVLLNNWNRRKPTRKDPPPLSFCTVQPHFGKGCKSPVSLFRMTGLLVAPAVSRTSRWGVKVPCLTAWRWRIVQDIIPYFFVFPQGKVPLFRFLRRLCAAFLQPAICEKPFFSS